VARSTRGLLTGHVPARFKAFASRARQVPVLQACPHGRAGLVIRCNLEATH